MFFFLDKENIQFINEFQSPQTSRKQDEFKENNLDCVSAERRNSKFGENHRDLNQLEEGYSAKELNVQSTPIKSKN